MTSIVGHTRLDFRDVHAVDDRTAFLLSIGAGDLSRIDKTGDGGATWTLSLTSHGPKGLLDAIAFWDGERGLALGDPLEGRFLVLATDDGGKHWTRIPPERMPPALPGEGAFAASGTCLSFVSLQAGWAVGDDGRIAKFAADEIPFDADNGAGDN